MIIIEKKPTYEAHHASLKIRRIKTDKYYRRKAWDGVCSTIIGLLIMFIPSVLGLRYISPGGAVVWILLGGCWLWAGLKAIGL